MIEKIFLREVGPREGCQIHPEVIPTEKKKALIESLMTTGVPQIEATSFVRGDLLPQMADAEELLNSLTFNSNTKISALYLNKKGFEKSISNKNLLTEGWIHTAVSESFLKKNSNKTHETVLSSLLEWKDTFAESQTDFRGLMLSTSFGCAYEGRKSPDVMTSYVESLFHEFSKLNFTPQEICLADTNGFGTPKTVKEAINKISAFGSEISLHLHDTRGAAIANAYAGLSEGVRIFEASVGGIGGCPFTKGASGNMASEDFLWLCEELNVSTGVDIDAYVKSAIFAENIFGKKLDGRFYRTKR